MYVTNEVIEFGEWSYRVYLSTEGKLLVVPLRSPKTNVPTKARRQLHKEVKKAGMAIREQP